MLSYIYIYMCIIPCVRTTCPRTKRRRCASWTVFFCIIDCCRYYWWLLLSLRLLFLNDGLWRPRTDNGETTAATYAMRSRRRPKGNPVRALIDLCCTVLSVARIVGLFMYPTVIRCPWNSVDFIHGVVTRLRSGVLTLFSKKGFQLTNRITRSKRITL